MSHGLRSGDIDDVQRRSRFPQILWVCGCDIETKFRKKLIKFSQM